MSKDSGVSEIIGTLLLLTITVALFMVVFAWASNFRPPERGPYVELSAGLDNGGDGWGNGNERVLISHRGGEPLTENNIEIIIKIDDSKISYRKDDKDDALKFPNGIFYLGDTWKSTGVRIDQDSVVYVSIIYHTENGAMHIWPEQKLVPTIFEKFKGLADLTLDEDDVSYTPPLMRGQNIVIWVNVKNIGKVDAGHFYIALFEGKETGGKVIKRVEVESIPAGGNKMVPVLYPSIPFDPTTTTKDITIFVDYLNNVIENNMGNNIVHLTLKPGGKATTALIENFEYDAGGWSHEGEQDEWELGGPTAWNGPQWFIYPDTAHWGGSCWGTDLDNTYNNNGDCWLSSPEVDLTGRKTAKLTFWHWYCFESGWDFGYLEITTDGGETWQKLKEYSGAETQWTYQELNLDEYIGNVVQLKFALKTDDYGTAAGWYIDDLSLTGS